MCVPGKEPYVGWSSALRCCRQPGPATARSIGRPWSEKRAAQGQAGAAGIVSRPPPMSTSQCACTRHRREAALNTARPSNRSPVGVTVAPLGVWPSCMVCEQRRSDHPQVRTHLRKSHTTFNKFQTLFAFQSPITVGRGHERLNFNLSHVFLNSL